MAGIAPDRLCQGTVVADCGTPGVLREREFSPFDPSHAAPLRIKTTQKAPNPFCFLTGMLPSALTNTFLVQIAKELLRNELALAVNCGMTNGT